VTNPVRFLAAFSQALSTVGLYGDEHPATVRAIHAALERLQELQSSSPKLQFTFLAGEVLCGSEAVAELEGWEWSSRFIKAGIERIEFTQTVQLEPFTRFLNQLAVRLGIRNGSSSELWQVGDSAIRFGQVSVGSAQKPLEESQLPVVTLTYSLREERETVDWVHQEIQSGAKLPLVEADAVVRSDTAFDLVEATTALACASNTIRLPVQLKREIGKLWDDIGKPPYKELFNASIPGVFVWRCVQIQRRIDKAIDSYVKRTNSGAAYGLTTHGNRIIAALVFEALPITQLKEPAVNIDSVASEDLVTALVDSRIKVLDTLLDQHYPNSIIPTLFKNLKKCEHLAREARVQLNPPT
jgi:hypothetical protein